MSTTQGERSGGHSGFTEMEALPTEYPRGLGLPTLPVGLGFSRQSKEEPEAVASDTHPAADGSPSTPKPRILCHSKSQVSQQEPWP